ncbi:hypothetical protein [Rhodosalinus sp. K401]|uniref:hypothetical protein n=1 Tax=Rhodosalinus sp. K401 TaxID=3239195 RepID=UPI0035232FF1
MPLLTRLAIREQKGVEDRPRPIPSRGALTDPAARVTGMGADPVAVMEAVNMSICFGDSNIGAAK